MFRVPGWAAGSLWLVMLASHVLNECDLIGLFWAFLLPGSRLEPDWPVVAHSSWDLNQGTSNFIEHLGSYAGDLVKMHVLDQQVWCGA